MERSELEDMVNVLSQDDLVAFMMEVNATDMQVCEPDWDELVDVSYFGHRGYSEMSLEELRNLSVDSLMEYADDLEDAGIAEYLEDEVRSGRALILAVLEKKK